MTHKHTPGPWHQGKTPGQELYVFDSHGRAIVQSVELKNVPLIAAAPDLLKALDLLIGAAEQHAMSNDPDIKKELETARAAFKQATQGA